MTTVATPPPLPPASGNPKGLTWIHISSILALSTIASVAGYCYFEYHSGATWDLPAHYTFLPLFFLAYFIGSSLLIGCSGPTNRWLRSFALLVAFASSFWLILEIDRREQLYLRGLAHAVSHADLEPFKEWARAHAPSEGRLFDRVLIENAAIPAEVRGTIPFKRGGKFFAFIFTSEEGDSALKIVHAGSGFVPLNGVIVNIGKDFDPKQTGFLQVQRVSSDVWVFVGGG